MNKTQRYTGAAPGRQARLSIPVVVVLLMDATASMAGYLKGAVRALTGFVDILFAGNLQPSLALVIFRDEQIGEPTQCYDVGTPAENIKGILHQTMATGGGDEPESSLPAITKALDLPGFPTGARKVLIHVTDAPCHDPENGLTAAGVLERLKQEGVLFHACCPDIEPYKKFVNATGGTLFPIHTGLREDEFEKVMLSFARTTVKTLRIGESAGVGELARQQLRKTRILEP